MSAAGGAGASVAASAGTAGAGFPPGPWHLTGDFAAGVFLVPTRDLPAHVQSAIPPRARVLSLLGRTPVVAGAVRYGGGGILSYDELLVAVPVRQGLRLAVTIPHIWVTSAVSQAGGRALWAIPKERMTARRRGSGRRLEVFYRDEDRVILADASVDAGLTLPGTWTLPMPTLQREQGGSVRAANRLRGHVHLARTQWAFGGALSWLSGRHPVLGLALTRAAVTFGAHVTRR